MDVTEKPAPMPVNVENVPSSLKSYDRWVCWSWIWDGDSKKFTKPPLNARTGYHAKSTDASTWVSFDEAIRAHQSGRFDGIGFTLGGNGSGVTFSGFDLDKCIVDGEIEAAAIYLAGCINSYTEISPSGNGIKVFMTGPILGPGKKKDDALRIEMYDSGRYFTVTGRHVLWSPREIFDRTQEMKLLRETIYPQMPPSIPKIPDRDIAVSALKALKKERATGYDSWLCVGMALKNISDDLLVEWDEWSRCSEKYAEGVCAKKWVTFKRSGIGIGSLIHWAKEDGWEFKQIINGHQHKKQAEVETDTQAKIKEKEREIAELKRQDQEEKNHQKELAKEAKEVERKKKEDEMKITFSKFGLRFADDQWWPGEWKLSVINSEPITFRLRTPFLGEKGIVLTADQFDSPAEVHKAILKQTGKVCLQDKPQSWECIWNGYKNKRGVKAKLIDDSDDEDAPAEIKRSYVVAQWLHRRLHNGTRIKDQEEITGNSHCYVFEDGTVAFEFMHVWREASESADKIKRPEMSHMLNDTLKSRKINKCRKQYHALDKQAFSILEEILGIMAKATPYV
jgi:Primase C terminal 2 (PriCT-2)